MAVGEGERRTTWSQGQILPPEAALAFQLVAAEEAASRFPIVITHDCDLAAAVEKEPVVELLIGRLISKLGAATNAKVARRLDLALQSHAGPLALALLAPDKRAVQKTALFK